MNEEVNHKIILLSNDLIKDNKYLINSFKIRLVKRILMIFNRHQIPFNKKTLEDLISEYYICNLRDTSQEVVVAYKKMLKKYYTIIDEYHSTHRNSKDNIKIVTAMFIKKLFSKDSDVLSNRIAGSFLEEMQTRMYVYDNANLIKEINSRIMDDTNDIIHELNKNNNKFLSNAIKEILFIVLN